MSEPLARALSEPDTRVAIIGGGVSGLIAARECARPGFRVRLLEAADRLGGTVGRETIAGLPVDTGAESFATRGGQVAALLDELGLAEDIESPNPAGAWLQLADRAVPLPAGGLLGVPGSPLAADVIAAIGWGGALRAYLDRLMPVMKIGHEQNFGRLVRRRMGAAVLTKLVAPITTGVYSADPDQVEVSAAVPGLNQALTRSGSLSGAVSELRAAAAAKQDAGRAGSAVAGLRGGMYRLVEVLEADARARGARIDTGARVVAVHRPAELPAPDPATAERPVPELVEGPTVDPATPAPPVPELVEGPTVDPSTGPDAVDDARPAAWSVETADGEVIAADVVLLAVPAAQALDLLRTVSPATAAAAGLDWPLGTPIELVTLVIDEPALAAAPRGTGMLVAAEADIQAKALTHASAKWPWLGRLAARTAPGRQVIRLSFGRVDEGDAPSTAAMSDAQLKDLAVREAATLLNMPLQESTVVGCVRTRWVSALPHAVLGQRERVQAVRESVAAVTGLEVTGSWLAGTGLASVVPDAKEAAARVRGLRWRLLTEKD